MTQRLLALAVAIAIPMVEAPAHHSIAGMYDTRQQITLEGVVRQFHWINPHPYLTMAVGTANGGVEPWQLEMDNRRELSQVGMTSDTLKEGDRIVVTGNPARSESLRLYIRRLDRARDGFGYEQVGSRPQISTQSR